MGQNHLPNLPIRISYLNLCDGGLSRYYCNVTRPAHGAHTGAVLDVGENHTRVRAMSGPGDVTVVAAQAPITEVEVTSSNGQIEAGSAAPLLAVTGTTRLPDPCAQAPIGSSQISAFSSSRGNEPVQIPTHVTQAWPDSVLKLLLGFGCQITE